MMVSREEEQDICEPSESMRVVICSSVCLSVLCISVRISSGHFVLPTNIAVAP